jgi:hypothetical protein
MENPFIKWDSFGGGTKDSSLNFMIILNKVWPHERNVLDLMLVL